MDGPLVWSNQHHQSGTLMPSGAVHTIFARSALLASSLRKQGPIRRGPCFERCCSTAFAQQGTPVVDGVDGPLRHQLCQNEVVQISDKGAVRGPDYPHWNGYGEAYFSAAWG